MRRHLSAVGAPATVIAGAPRSRLATEPTPVPTALRVRT
jgi:hypothetical protein